MLNFNKDKEEVMVKKILIAGLYVILGSSLYAVESSSSKMLLGLEVGAATIKADANTDLLRRNNHKGSDAEYGFRIGAQSDEWRAMFVFNYFNSNSDNQNYEKGLFELDYFILSSDLNDVSFKPYIGANIGYMNYESDRTLYMFSIDESGLLYGGQVGLIISITDNVDIDLMYRYSITDAKHTSEIGSFLFGINYVY
jgi:opacity protein-like surface antigen